MVAALVVKRTSCDFPKVEAQVRLLAGVLVGEWACGPRGRRRPGVPTMRVQLPPGPLLIAGRVGTSASPLASKVSAVERTAAGSTPAPSAVGRLAHRQVRLLGKQVQLPRLVRVRPPLSPLQNLAERQGHPRSVPVRTRLCEGRRSGSIPDGDADCWWVWCSGAAYDPVTVAVPDRNRLPTLVLDWPAMLDRPGTALVTRTNWVRAAAYIPA